MDFQAAFDKIDQLTPQQGFNVVGIDEYGSPDEQGPYLVGNFATREEAEAVVQKMTAQSGEQFYIYAPDGM